MSTKRIAYSKIKEIMSVIEGVELKDKSGGNFRFPMYLTEKAMNTDIEALDLSVRSSHALKRFGYRTIGDVMENISSSSDLKKIRNCGAKSIEEIMERLFVYQFNVLSPENKVKYIDKVIEMNT